MISTGFQKNILISIVTALFIFLFLYAASSKIIDHQKFEAQLGQSPMLNHFAGVVSWIIPLGEILICALLAIPTYRLSGLYASFSLMVLFTSYIIAITRYSEFIPCSCGGILQDMTWNQHLLFNLLFIVLALLAILFYPRNPNDFIAIKTGQAENL